MGFESTIPAFELAKTVHALVRAATVIGFYIGYRSNILQGIDLFLCYESESRLLSICQL
jgi:hypothetical protein